MQQNIGLRDGRIRRGGGELKIRRLAAVVALSVGIMSLGTSLHGAAIADERGAHLAEDVSASRSTDGSLKLDSVTAFAEDGGTAVLEPGTEAEEYFRYSGIDTGENELTGVERPSASTHLSGSFVEAVAVEGSVVGSPDIDSTDADLDEYALDVATTSTIASLPLVNPLAGAVCYGRSHNPHKAKHDPGMVAAVGETECPHLGWVDMGVRTSLYRFSRADGAFLRVAGPLVDVTETFRKGSWRVSRRPLYKCPGTPTPFQLRSFHWVFFDNGTYDDGNTQNVNTPKC